MDGISWVRKTLLRRVSREANGGGVSGFFGLWGSSLGMRYL